MNIGVIVGMATLTVAGAVTQKVLEGSGKTSAAQFVELATIAGLATTAITIFATFIKAVSRLG
jgi:hypothetical protein